MFLILRSSSPLLGGAHADVVGTIAKKTVELEPSLNVKTDLREESTLANKPKSIQSPFDAIEDSVVAQEVKAQFATARSLPFKDVSNQPSTGYRQKEKSTLSSVKRASDAKEVALATSTKPSNAIQFNPDQTLCMPFPIGCKVSANLQFDSNGFLQSCVNGQVVGVHLDMNISDVKFELVLEGNGDRHDSIVFVGGGELGYVKGSQVFYSHSDFSGNSDGQAKSATILMCRKVSNSPQFLYTILTASSESDSSQVIGDVPSNQLKPILHSQATS